MEYTKYLWKLYVPFTFTITALISIPGDSCIKRNVWRNWNFWRKISGFDWMSDLNCYNQGGKRPGGETSGSEQKGVMQ